MAFFRNLFRHDETPKSPSPEQEPKQEIVPEHSAETLETVRQIDGKIADSEVLSAGLDRVAREKILTDPEALQEIYVHREIGRLGLKAKDDAWALESAGRGLRVKNSLIKILGGGGSDYVLEHGEKLLDKRKLNPRVKEAIVAGGKSDLSPDELAEVAEKFGLKPEEINQRDFKKIYAQGKNGVEKVILGKNTEQEMDTTAGEILARRLNDLETKTGPDLIKQKQGLEEFKKLREQNKDILNEESVQAKLAGEENTRQGMIGEKQETLNSNLEIFRAPLLEQQKGLAEALAGFSPLLVEATGQEKAYETEIKGLQDKIKRIKGAKPLAEVLGDKIQEWEEQKAKAEVNLKDFRGKKEALNMRLAELKRSKAEVDKTVERINKIGKTPAELKAEQEAKKQEEKRQREAEAAAAAVPKQTGEAKGAGATGKRTAESSTADWEASRLPVGGFDSDVVGQEAADQEISRDDSSDDIPESPNMIRRRAAFKAATLYDRENGGGKPAPKQQLKTRRAPAPAAERTAPVAGDAILEWRPGEGSGKKMEKRETDMVRPIRFWLNAIFKGKLPPDREKIIMKNFKIKTLSEEELTVEITSDKAQKAYAGCLIDQIKLGEIDLEPEFAWVRAAADVREIVKHIDAYDRKEEAATALRRGQAEPTKAEAEPTKATGAPAAEDPVAAEQRKAEFARRAREGTVEMNARQINIPGRPESGVAPKSGVGQIVKPEAGQVRKAQQRGVGSLDDLALGMDAAIAGKDTGTTTAPEQVELLSRTKAKGRKPKGGEKSKGDRGEKPPAGNRAARRLREQELEEKALRDEARAKEQGGTPKEDEAAPKIEVGTNPLINNGLGVALGQVEDLVKEGEGKPAHDAKPAETAPEAATNSEQAGAEEEGMKLLVEAVKAKLKEENGDRKRKVRRAIDRIFGSVKNPKEIKTEEELAEAIVSYIKDMRGQDGEIALSVAQQRIADIKKSFKQ